MSSCFTAGSTPPPRTLPSPLEHRALRLEVLCPCCRAAAAFGGRLEPGDTIAAMPPCHPAGEAPGERETRGGCVREQRRLKPRESVPLRTRVGALGAGRCHPHLESRFGGHAASSAHRPEGTEVGKCSHLVGIHGGRLLERGLLERGWRQERLEQEVDDQKLSCDRAPMTEVCSAPLPLCVLARWDS